jgi:mono/diheme cytochrome c family protein
MKPQVRLGLALVLAAVGAVPVLAQDTAATTAKQSAPANTSAGAAPSGVTPELIAQGEKVYNGPGNCYACHGQNGQGAVGPSLADAEWLHSKGTFEEIVAQVTKGVPPEESKSGIPMPAKGGSSISDDDVKAVAAYVYSLSHK